MTFLLFVLVPMAIVAPFALRRWSEVRAGHRRAWTTSERLLVLANSSFNIVLYMPVWPGLLAISESRVLRSTKVAVAGTGSS